MLLTLPMSLIELFVYDYFPLTKRSCIFSFRNNVSENLKIRYTLFRRNVSIRFESIFCIWKENVRSYIRPYVIAFTYDFFHCKIVILLTKSKWKKPQYKILNSKNIFEGIFVIFKLNLIGVVFEFVITLLDSNFCFVLLDNELYET